jgi:LEA14-like dessication related protein
MNIKKNKIKLIGFLILVIIVVSIAVIFIFRVRIVSHFIPTVKQVDEIQIKINNDTAFISSKLLVTNKSLLNVHIDSISYEVSLLDKMYLQNKELLGIELPGHGKDTIDFSLNIPYKNILKDLKAQRKNGDSTSYTINISLQYSTIFGKVKIPINKSAKFKIPQPPELSVEEIKYKKIHLKYILAEAKIKIINYSELSLSIKDLSYSMNILKQGNLKGNLMKEIIIKPKGTTIVMLPIKININNIGKTLFEVIMNKDNYDYILNLNAILEVSNPLKDSFNINISKAGIMELIK